MLRRLQSDIRTIALAASNVGDFSIHTDQLGGTHCALPTRFKHHL
jgi:hypothetical protein